MKQFAVIIAFLSIGFIGLNSCKKYEIKDIDISKLPNDSTITEAAKENYINKLFILLLGRKADETEFSQSLTLLNNGNASQNAREQLFDYITIKPEYYINLYKIARKDLMDDADTNLIRFDYNEYSARLLDINYIDSWPFYQEVVNENFLLLQIPAQLPTGYINMIDVHKRCIDNLYYDEINMGTENFVVSMFQHFFLRYPTNAELTSSKNMVDGVESVVFLKNGSSKSDFIQIFFDTGNYFEGQVRILYEKYLYRQPTESELADATYQYKNNKNYKILQKSILTKSEFLGQ
jgi:hypothetical protein